MGDRIEVPLDLTDLEVAGTELVEGTLEVMVQSSFPRACYHCGSVDVVGHGTNLRRLRDRSHGFPTVLVWRQRRFRCRDCCRTSRERHPAMAGQKRLTTRFRDQIAQAACSEPWVDIVRREQVSWWRVLDSFQTRAAAHDRFSGEPPRVISMDESAFRRRFRFHTVLSAPEQGRIFELTEGRSQRSAQQALAALPIRWREAVETVVIDLYWPYRKAIEAELPGTRIVADKFHIVRSVDAAAQKVRIRHGRRRTVVGRDGGISRQHNPRFDSKVFNSRWLFMRRSHNLNKDEQAALDYLFELHPEIGVAWWLKEAFAAIYRASNRTDAEQQLDLWVHHVEQAGLKEFTDLWRTLSHWRDPILAYFDDPQTNAYAEGITNKIKVMKRRGYGHRHQLRYRDKVLLITSHQPA